MVVADPDGLALADALALAGPLALASAELLAALLLAALLLAALPLAAAALPGACTEPQPASPAAAAAAAAIAAATPDGDSQLLGQREVISVASHGGRALGPLLSTTQRPRPGLFGGGRTLRGGPRYGPLAPGLTT
jgi:hypothetical protein